MYYKSSLGSLKLKEVVLLKNLRKNPSVSHSNFRELQLLQGSRVSLTF
jgi:hypothetical protein